MVGHSSYECDQRQGERQQKVRYHLERLYHTGTVIGNYQSLSRMYVTGSNAFLQSAAFCISYTLQA